MVRLGYVLRTCQQISLMNGLFDKEVRPIDMSCVITQPLMSHEDVESKGKIVEGWMGMQMKSLSLKFLSLSIKSICA